jgi:hypothetical protein
MTELRAQERAFDATIVFRVVSTKPTNTLAGQLPRRERWILLLLDGKRCIADLAHLTIWALARRKPRLFRAW